MEETQMIENEAPITPVIVNLEKNAIQPPLFHQEVYDQQKERHKKRAQRFGVDFKEPPKDYYLTEQERKRYKNPEGGFITGFDTTSLEEKLRREERAKKYSSQLGNAENQAETPMELDKPPATVEQLKTVDPSVKRRFDTIHMHGTDTMNNNHIFSYFAEYGPTFLEWINDSSCNSSNLALLMNIGNILFADNHSARRALLGLSKPIILEHPTSGNSTGENKQPIQLEEEEEKIDILDEENLIVPSITQPDSIECSWRKGLDWKDQTILLRFATVEDVRPQKPNKSQRLWIKRNQLNKEEEQKKLNKRARPVVASMELSLEEQEKRKKRRQKFGGISAEEQDKQEEQKAKRRQRFATKQEDEEEGEPEGEQEPVNVDIPTETISQEEGGEQESVSVDIPTETTISHIEEEEEEVDVV